MAWGKKDDTKKRMSGPKAIPEKIARYIVGEIKEDARWLSFLMSVTRYHEDNTQEIRIYDPGEAEAARVQVSNYEALDTHPELVIFELVTDAKMEKIDLKERKMVLHSIPILSQDQIQARLEALGNGTKSAIFFTAAGPNAGGPLGRGCAIVDLNPEFPAKSNKKYIISTDDVLNMQPVGRKVKLWDSQKAKDVASWLMQTQRERFV
jgi:hypothetical protein